MGNPETGPFAEALRPGNPAGLRARRCARHETREAVARCPKCGGFFCRECVSEHEARLLCTACLALEVASKQVQKPRRKKLPQWAGRAFSCTAGFLFLWLLLYLGGTLLLRIPPDFHSGDIFQVKDEGGESP